MRFVRPQAFVCLGVVSLLLLGCGGSSSSTTTTAAPVASFTAPSGAVTAGQSVAFSDTSTGTPTTWAWTFGDGGTSTAQNPTHTYATARTFTVTLTATNAAGSAKASKEIIVSSPANAGAFPIVDTSQSKCFDATSEITTPLVGAAFYGQDAQLSGIQPSYTKSSDGLTVKDNVTGLTWQQSHYTGQVYWAEAETVASTMNAANVGGYSDWRLPTIKELYSLWNGSTGWPFIDTSQFTTSYASQDELSHAIFWSSTKYSGLLESTEDGASNVGAELAFGLNFGTGHIKAYSIASGPRHLVRCVRGASYGINSFLNQGDGTIKDQATGLMWAQTDSGSGMDWEHALAHAQAQNAVNYLGHSDWRLPSSKELQSLVDYTRSPGAKDLANAGPAIDPLFTCTGMTNEAGAADYPWYWTSTTNPGLPGATTYDTAWYVAFGRAVGSDGKDLHGAGAVRFDTKMVGTPGGQSRYYNFVRLVRESK
jgi:PKD repeat protein